MCNYTSSMPLGGKGASGGSGGRTKQEPLRGSACARPECPTARPKGRITLSRDRVALDRQGSDFGTLIGQGALRGRQLCAAGQAFLHRVK
jgi:hypothetical protein